MNGGVFDRAALTAIVEHYVQANRFMGNVLIAQGDQIVFEASFGYANLELNASHSPLTKFRIASVTKPFTAAAIMVLEGRGLMRLEDRVTAHLPDFPDGDKITVRHLLNHASGITNYTSLPGFERVTHQFHTLPEVIALFAGKPLEFEPGSRHAYSNSNYIVLMAILESISGESYADALRELVLEPLGLQDTGVDDSALVLPDRASGYAWASNAYHHAQYMDIRSALLPAREECTARLGTCSASHAAFARANCWGRMRLSACSP